MSLSSEKKSNQPVVVVLGAGLVGSLWAYLMTQRGYKVHVFEKRPHPDLEKAPQGRSINLVITSRGVHGLVKAGLKDKILGITVPVYGRSIHSKNQDVLFQPYGRDKSECNYSVSRWDLNKALTRELLQTSAQVYFDHELLDISLDRRELKFKNPDGEVSLKYDRIFATDGAGSVIRKALAAKEPKNYTENVEWLSSDYKEISWPKIKNIDSNALHIWPRGSHMMMGLSNQDGSMTMTTYQPRTDHEWSFDKLNTIEAIENYFKSEYPDVAEIIPNYAQQFLENPQGRLATVRMSRWNYKDEIVLMGDAAHAIVPFFGQGMNLGFEDATTLIKLIETQKPDTNEDWEKVFTDFDYLQRPNANAIADMALENFIEMRDKVGQLDFQKIKQIESKIEKAYPMHYRSRYGLITYTLTPYRLAQEAGLKQAELLNYILDDLNAKKVSVENLNPADYLSLIESNISNWYKSQKINIETYHV